MYRFPIGFWNYTAAGQLGTEAVRDWKELGMSFVMSPQFHPDKHDKALMIDILDECHKEGLPVIMNDARARWEGAATKPEAYCAQFAQAVADFGHHPAVVGFHVGDEPMTDEAFADASAAHRLQLEVAPHLAPHLNFLPYWPGQEQDVLKTDSFNEWACKMVKEAKLDILCYDCYSQMNPGEEGFQFYFTNLRKFGEAAIASGATPWTTLLSVGHFRYRVPTEDDLRWQLNTAVASGMKGILWFFVYAVVKANYRLSPIDEFGERTQTFTALSRVNRHFLHRFGDFFHTAKHTATYHVLKSYGGFAPFIPGDTSPIIRDVRSDHDLPAVLGFFEKEGHKYIALVNNSPWESDLFKIYVPRDAKTFARLEWNGNWDELKDNHHDAFYREDEKFIIGGDWLAPGQMMVYRYE